MSWTRLFDRWTDRLASLGQFRHRVTLYGIQTTPDGAGGVTQIFLPLATLWAAITPVSVEAATAPRQIGEMLTYRIVIRYRDDVKVGMRFQEGNKRYTIRQVMDPDALKTRLLCLCTQEHA